MVLNGDVSAGDSPYQINAHQSTRVEGFKQVLDAWRDIGRASAELAKALKRSDRKKSDIMKGGSREETTLEMLGVGGKETDQAQASAAKS